ncbi:hypothetical protein Psta_0260 [Pirellula staleyi DSM 6068]|uniref:Uncharacterized protein n=1 Tax=Pirellula staleyi (strain ATCC 27377 / DSM 6068 / ICPB 4128) TaxID=530564 RepID=D2R1H0_PIRSD|nr:hypothetical protein Psta_0260 [Pirellula staleyi DSM 6068]
MTIEKCDCKFNERPEAKRIKITKKPTTLLVEVISQLNQSESVRPGKVCGIALNRSYEQLLQLGDGEHTICNCTKMISEKDSYPSSSKK